MFVCRRMNECETLKHLLFLGSDVVAHGMAVHRPHDISQLSPDWYCLHTKRELNMQMFKGYTFSIKRVCLDWKRNNDGLIDFWHKNVIYMLIAASNASRSARCTGWDEGNVLIVWREWEIFSLSKSNSERSPPLFPLLDLSKVSFPAKTTGIKFPANYNC